MLTYYIDYRETASRQFEIHHGGCPELPERNSLIYLGKHRSGVDALNYARTLFTNMRACKRCCPECNLLEAGADYQLGDARHLQPDSDATH